MAFLRRTSHFAFTLAVTLGLLIFGMTPNSAAAPEVTISGTLTVATTGAPVDYAYVGWVSDSTVKSTTTDAAGKYILHNVTPGSVGILVADPIYRDPWSTTVAKHPPLAVQWWKNATGRLGATTVTVPTLGQNVVADFSLTTGAGLVGKTNLAGVGVGKVKIQAFLPGDPENWPTAQTVSAADGTWKLPNLGAGLYKLHYIPDDAAAAFDSWSGGQDSQTAAKPVTVGTTGLTNLGNVDLPGAGSIVGTVGNAGTPFVLSGSRGPYVTAHPVGGVQDAVYTQTKTDGTFLLPKLRVGTYKLEYSPLGKDAHRSMWYKDKTNLNDATTITVKAGPPVRADQTLPLRSTFSGTVKTSQGGPVSGANVSCYEPATYRGLGYATTATDGSWTMLVEPNSRCNLTVGTKTGNFLPWWSGNASTFDTAQPIFTGAGTVQSGINVTLTAGSTITGTVKGNLQGVPTGLPDVGVSVWKMTGPDSWERNLSPAWTTSSGAFTIERVPAGTYVVHVYPQYAPGSWVGQWWGGATILSATKLTVAAGGSATAQISISGSVAETVYGAEDAEVFARTNTARATGRTCGTTYYPAVAPLLRDLRLDVAARRHSQDMAAENYFAHESLNGANPTTRAVAAGWTVSSVGENAAAGQKTPAEVVADWLASSGHCANLMRPNYTHFGTGKAVRMGSRFGVYWTQNFSAAPTAAGLPGSPTSVVAAGGDGAVAITWNGAAANGAPVENYTATANPGGKTCTTTGARGCVINGLTNGTSYTFTVRATNRAGVGAASGPSVPTIPSSGPATPPGAPGTLNVKTGSTVATGTWVAPTNTGGAPIVSYTLVALSPSGAAHSCTATTTSCTITGLINGTTYTFTVRATNRAGVGAASTPTSATPTGPPSAPLSVAVLQSGANITVTWNSPVTTGGVGLTGYEVSAAAAGHLARTCSVAPTVRTCTFAALPAPASYTFTVRANNSNGFGPGAQSTALVATVPTAPLSLRSTSFPKPGQVSAAWGASSSDGGAPVLGYSVWVEQGGVRVVQCADTVTTSCGVAGLRPGQELL